MGIQSSSATFVRFLVPDGISGDFWGHIDEGLKKGGFKECQEDQEQAMGFATWEDLFDSSFAENTYQKGEYVAFQFRLDQRSVPAIIRKQYIKRKIQEYRTNHQGKWPSRQERMEIQEAVQGWLLNRMLPKPSGAEVVWSTTGKWLLLGVAGTKMIDAFLGHFEKHMGIYPLPLYHVQWAMHLVPLPGPQKDTLGSLVSLQSSQAMYEGRFLGNEFLTWLWFLAETSDGLVRLSEERSVEVDLGDRLALVLPADGRERVVCTTQANALHEARTALRQGKLVDELNLCLRIQDNEYSFTLDSFLWAVRGLKTPKQLPDPEEDDEDGRFLEKMYFVEEVFSVLGLLYGRFLNERLTADWERKTLPGLRKWIEDSSLDAGERGSHPDSPPF